MFEDAMLKGSPKGKRLWTTCAGVTGQVVLVAGMAVAPMVWPEAMPPAVFTMLVPTAPPGPRAKPNEEPKARRNVAPDRKKYIPTSGIVQPTIIPPTIQAVNDGPTTVVGSVAPTGPWVVGGFDPDKVIGPARDIARDGQDLGVKPVVKVDPVKPPDVVPVQRLRGGLVDPPRLVYRVEPVYPPLARVAHVEGVVKLKGVIATDGHIIALALESGHPLLAPAALAAVRQWRYTATRLNGVPVEVETAIVVTFHLAR